MAHKDLGVTYGFWTNKVITEITKLIAEGKQVEDYDLDQLRDMAGKDVRDHYAKIKTV